LNLGEAKAKSLSLMAEYSVDGVAIPDGENADYLNRMNRFSDQAQKEIAQYKKIPAVKLISQDIIPNQIAQLYAFDLKQKLNTDVIESAVGCQAYYFEVDGIADIYVEESINGVWTILKTINNTVKGQYTKFKGLLTPSSLTNQVRLRFSGLYVYSIRNRALYAYTFPTDDDVPEASAYIKYEMPDDFMELNKVILVSDPRSYSQLAEYFWEGKKTFVTNAFKTGAYQIHYYRYPTTITKDTPDTYEFEVDTEAQEAIPFFLAGQALMDENAQMAIQRLNEYQMRLSKLSNQTQLNVTTISESYWN
jgi:hypothetical protein